MSYFNDNFRSKDAGWVRLTEMQSNLKLVACMLATLVRNQVQSSFVFIVYNFVAILIYIIFMVQWIRKLNNYAMSNKLVIFLSWEINWFISARQTGNSTVYIFTLYTQHFNIILETHIWQTFPLKFYFQKFQARHLRYYANLIVI